MWSIIHSNVKYLDFNGEKYFVSFIDDYSHIAQIYCLKNKSEVYDKFVEYFNFIINIISQSVQQLRCDNGTEYLNGRFYEFAKKKGFKIAPCTSYNHKLNVVAERYNRTIMDRVRLTWELFDRCEGQEVIDVKWLYMLKPEGHYKAHLVARGFHQNDTFEETYAPVTKLCTLKTLLAVSCSCGYHVHHMDVQTAFLNSAVKSNIFVEQPKGCVKVNENNKVYHLKKSLFSIYLIHICEFN